MVSLGVKMTPIVKNLFTRGKTNSAESVVKTFSEKISLPENLSHLDMDLFKLNGKFNKGEAIFNGKPFTGTIYTKNDRELIYKNGVLKYAKGESGTKSYDGGKLSEIEHNDIFVGYPRYTSVKRSPDGTRVITKRLADHSHNGVRRLLPDSHNIVTTIKPDGSVMRASGGVEYRAKEMKGKFICDKIENLTTGGVKLVKKDFIPANDGGFFRQQKIVDGKKVTEEFNGLGELSSTWTTEFNPETKVSTQITKNSLGNIKSTIQRDKNGYVLECKHPSPYFSDDEPIYKLWNTNCDEFFDDSKLGLGRFSGRNPFADGVKNEVMKKYILENNIPFQI